jgi:hypothetical protein
MVNSVWILSAGRSGSTLLDRLIGAHPMALPVGELRKLPRDISLRSVCSCGASIEACPFWAPVVAELSHRLGVDLWRNPYALDLGFSKAEVEIDARRQTKGYLLRRAINNVWTETGARLGLDLQRSPWFAAHRKPVENIEMLHEYLRSHAQRQLIVDSTKAYRISVTHHALHPERVRLILHSRDGRGVMASVMRSGKSRAEAVRSWSGYYDGLFPWLERYVQPEHILRVRYEELVADPQAELGRIFKFLGMPVPAAPLNPDENEHHILSGNTMRLGKIGEVKLDERWRRELSEADLEYFAAAGGATSRKLGYSI